MLPRSCFLGLVLIGAIAGPLPAAGPTPTTLLADPRVQLTIGEQRLVLEGGLQPFLLGTATGALVMQSQLPDVKPFDSPIPHYSYAMGTVISRDDGASWSRIPLKPKENGGDFEGGMVQLRNGSILALSTFVVAGKNPGEGRGTLYFSKDDWRTLEGPLETTFHIPGVSFDGGIDDQGHTNTSWRLHRRILELPNGDLLTTFYCCFTGDHDSCPYMKGLYRTRVVLLRSTNRGRHWELISTVDTDLSAGTEGYTEAVIVRLSHGPHPGRLICQMRTGRELREAISDDEGRTWAPSKARVYADRDVYRTEKWANQFRGVRLRPGAGGSLDKKGHLIDNDPVELVGAVVDPDLLELRNGVLVAAFGVRVPPRACWPRAEFPWNGNYIAISLDHGDTWSHVVQLTSGVLTTHYMAIEEMSGSGRFFVTYDLGDWRSHRGKAVYGRAVEVATTGDVQAR
jgi:hypothetical protein